MKKHNIVKVVLVTLFVILLLSWILPAAYYSGEFVDQGRVQMGLSELFNYPLTAMSYFGHISLFLILVGCFYGVLYKIPAYRTYLDWVVAKFKGREIAFITLIVFLLAFGVSIAGLNVAFALFIPLFVSLILLMGYDKIVATLTVVGGITAGLIGSTYSYNNLSLLYSILSLKNDYQIGVRFIILLAAIILVLFNIVVYIKKGKHATVSLDSTKDDSVQDVIEVAKVEENVSTKESKTSSAKKTSTSTAKKTTAKKSTTSKKTTSKSKSTKSKNPNKAALKQEDMIIVKNSGTNSVDDSYLVPEKNVNPKKVWPFVVGFLLLFILLVLSFITWGENGFGITVFDEVTEKFTNFELFKFPIFAKVYGSVNSFGNWSLIDLFLPVTLLTVLLAVIYSVKIDDFFDGVVSGAKKAAAPALIALILYTILVATTYHPFQLTIYKAVLGLTKGYNIVTTSIVAILSSVFNVEPAYTFQGVVPYYTSIVTNVKNYSNAGIIFQTMYGFVSMFAPTSLLLMCVLSYTKVNYKDWLKATWKLLLELLIVLIIVFIVLAI